jgi:hypothetical protein
MSGKPGVFRRGQGYGCRSWVAAFCSWSDGAGVRVLACALDGGCFVCGWPPDGRPAVGRPARPERVAGRDDRSEVWCRPTTGSHGSRRFRHRKGCFTFRQSTAAMVRRPTVAWFDCAPTACHRCPHHPHSHMSPGWHHCWCKVMPRTVHPGAHLCAAGPVVTTRPVMRGRSRQLRR